MARVEPVAAWPLREDLGDLISHGAELGLPAPPGGPTAAVRLRRGAWLEVPADRLPRFGRKAFSLSLRFATEEPADDVFGDLASCWDPAARQGFNLSLLSGGGVTSSQPNYRQLVFSGDNGTTPRWESHGRVGQAVMICGLAVCEGELFAATFQPEAGDHGRVYRWRGGSQWEDCALPIRANSVGSLAVWQGKLFAGTSHYRAGGSALADSPNTEPGGEVYRYDGEGQWVCCGKLPGHDEVDTLAVFRDQLYAMPRYTAGVFRYAGGWNWEACGVPKGCRGFALGVYRGELHAALNEYGGVARTDGGPDWRDSGQPTGESQIYSLVTYQNHLLCGSWPSGAVYRWDGDQQWLSLGQLGDEKEVMPMAVYNGALYGGTLPSSAVYRYDGPEQWANIGQPDLTPDVKYRRTWAMAVAAGRLFCGTLPAGEVHSLRTGAVASYDHAVAPGWHHLTAVRDHHELRVYLDGRLEARSESTDSAQVQLPDTGPWWLGRGATSGFDGWLADVQIHEVPLADAEIKRLAARG